MPPPTRNSRLNAARGGLLTALAVIAGTAAGAVVAAALGSVWWTAAALALSLVQEGQLLRSGGPLAAKLAHRTRSGAALVAVRMIAVLLLASHDQSHHVIVAVAVVTVGLIALAVLQAQLAELVARASRWPLRTRGLDLGGADWGPPRRWSMGFGLVDALVPLIAVTGREYPAISLPIAVAVAAWPVLGLGYYLGHARRTGIRDRMTEAAQIAVAALAPEVVLYFDASVEELYQLRMWLEPVARLNRPAAVVLRSAEVFVALGETPLPVISTPYNGTIASLPLPPRVVTLFVTHSGNNLAIVRRPETRTVFVGHGDSDKPDSMNPFARVYDEVWVAGPLGRRRYQQAAIGVSDDAIVEVGRPQLEEPVGAEPPTPATVVYAPTWEGWGDDPHHSSLAQVGPKLVAALAAHPELRVRYRPHPLTGQRSPALRAAHQQVIGLVGRVPDTEPLAETLAAATAVVTDVSSLISEFLPYDRTYALVDTRGLGAAAFVARFPSAAGGFLIDAGLDGLDAFLGAAGGGTDPTAEARRALLVDSLGDPATAADRFAAAVDRLLGE
jgi:CDP-Glycerol:Poly(glycerophosphate) glycerophosphotransferase